MDPSEIVSSLATPEGRADPYPLYAALHKIGEAVELGPRDVMVIGYDAINAVLRDPGFRVTGGRPSTGTFPSGGLMRSLSRPPTGS
jgi:hypothetical protein